MGPRFMNSSRNVLLGAKPTAASIRDSGMSATR
jgi:hypothetical protein